MMDTTKITADWLAGFFDGEGCVCLQMQNGYIRLRVNITQADKDLLDTIKIMYKADYVYEKRRKNSEKVVYEVGWYGESCGEILSVLDGRVVKKQEQVTLALKFLKTMVGSGHKLSPEILAERESLRNKVRQLNYVGPNKPNTELPN